MKKILPLLLLITGMVNAQIVNIPDATFKTQLLSASPTVQIAQGFSDQWIKIDANNDGEIQVSEAQAVKALSITEMLIFNVTGINSFSNLESFNVSSSLITTLDLSALTHLKTVACFNMQILSGLNVNSNTNLTGFSAINLPNLTALNLGNLSNLTSLSIYGTAIVDFNANGLTSLNELFYYANNHTLSLTVNGLTNLTKLACPYNNLSILNLSGLSSLTELDCSGNQLTNLNGVPNVAKLNCENNRLTTLNLNGLTSLSELHCGSNEITALNVNGLTNLTKLYCTGTKIATLNISGLANLATLDVSYNKELTNVTLNNLPNLQEFGVYGIVNSASEILSNLTTLNLSGLPNLQKLQCSYGKLTSLDLSNLSSLTEVYCSSNLITNLNLTNLPNLQKLDCSSNHISTIDASGLHNLTELTCGNAYIEAGQFTGPFLTSINVAGLTNLKTLNCSVNQLSSLDLTGLTNLENLYCYGVPGIVGHITSLSVNNLSNLKKLSCSYQALTSLDVSNLINLTDLNCDHNNISSLNLTGLVNLQVLDYTYNQLANLNLINLPSLQYLFCGHNALVTLNVLNLTGLKTLSCPNNQLTTLNLTGLTNLLSLDFSYNQLSLANVSGLSSQLGFLACSFNNLTSLNVSGLTGLTQLSCDNNQLASLDTSSLTNLRYLYCNNNELTNLTVGSLQNLDILDCSHNQLSSIDISGLTNLYGFSCAYNQLTSLDLSNHQNLSGLNYSYNAIPNLDLSSMINLKNLSLESTQTTVLDVSLMAKLEALGCQLNDIPTIDVSNCPNLDYLSCSNNNALTTLLMKNGRSEQSIDLYNTPNLQYICADTAQIATIQAILNSNAMTDTVCGSYCTFTPGGNHNTITGITIFDANNDGCDVTDEVNPFIRLNINDQTTDGATVTNINGTYNFFTNAGDYTIAPNVENPTWFDFTPASANFSFPDNNNNISTQNFCIAAVGVHSDIEVVVAPIGPARPGFDAQYKIVYKNKGNQMHSGTVSFAFDDTRADLISASPDVDATGTNSLSWNYVNLMPFENRSIIVTLNMNAPDETPALNNGDILNYTASITPVTGDELPNDNQYTFNQLVVGSYDPNSIECLEGETVPPTEIGNYLHYAVNFENLGSYEAENIVVRSEIDTTKYDINTLQVMNTSHPSYTRITGNVVEFVFQNIHLAAAHGSPPVGGHGDVLFKIKTKETVSTNDMVIQRAGIYFDYNFPVATNDAETTFVELSNPIFEQDNSVKIFPNPTSSIINIDSDFSIESIELYDIQGRILETHFENASTSTLDISNKSNGIYFLKIKTEKGSKVEKIVKE